MPNVLIESSTMEGIGDAIRKKTGKVDKIYPHDMPEAIERIESGEFLTKEEADGRYLKLAGGELEPEAEITQTNGKMKLTFSAVNGLLTEQNEPDGISYYTYICPGVIGVGDNYDYIEIGTNYAVLNGVDFSCDNERNLNISAGRILGVPTVTDAVEDSEYTDQNSDAASVGYVRQAISAAIGDINSILDAINGEVV